MILLNNLTVIIPYREDSIIRRQNLVDNLAYLNDNFEVDIIVCEQSTEQTANNIPYKYRYLFVPLDYEYMSKCKMINKASRMVSTPVFSVNDVDCLTEIKCYEESRNKVIDGSEFVVGHNGDMYHVPSSVDSLYFNPNTGIDNVKGIVKREGPPVAGGIIYLDTKAFFECGMFNEKFISWGGEDMEIFYRYGKLGKRIGGASGPLFHMEHPRSLNSCDKHEYYKSNVDEMNKVMSMNPTQLREYIKTWKWVKE